MLFDMAVVDPEGVSPPPWDSKFIFKKQDGTATPKIFGAIKAVWAKSWIKCMVWYGIVYGTMVLYFGMI